MQEGRSWVLLPQNPCQERWRGLSSPEHSRGTGRRTLLPETGAWRDLRAQVGARHVQN